MATAFPDGSSVGFEVRGVDLYRDVARMLDPTEIWEICWLDPRLELFLMFLELYRAASAGGALLPSGSAAGMMGCTLRVVLLCKCQVTSHLLSISIMTLAQSTTVTLHNLTGMLAWLFFYTFLNSDNCLDAFQFNNVAIGSGYLCVLQIGSEIPLLNHPTSVCVSATNLHI